jgi:hypothetical protein
VTKFYEYMLDWGESGGDDEPGTGQDTKGAVVAEPAEIEEIKALVAEFAVPVLTIYEAQGSMRDFLNNLISAQRMALSEDESQDALGLLEAKWEAAKS